MNAVSQLLFPTVEWLDHFRGRLHANERFREASVHWNDDALYVIEADPAAGWERDCAFYMRWQSGVIIRADVVEEPSRYRAVFKVSGPYSAWAHVHRDRMDAGIAFLTGKFRFEGPFAKAAKNIKGEVLMLQQAYEIPSLFHPLT